MPDLFKDKPALTPTITMPKADAPAPPPVVDKTTPPAAEPAKPFDAKSGARKLMDMMTSPTDDGEGNPTKKDEPKAPEKKAEEPPKKPEKPITVPKKKEPAAETRPPIPKASDLNKAPDKVAAPPAATEVPEDFEKSLHEEEKVLLDDARGAEKYLSEKYKGHGGKMEKFLKDAAAKEKEVGDDFTEEDYKKWYDENRPKISAVDLRQVERARMREEITRDVEPKLAEERHARWTETEAPKIEAKAVELRGKIWADAIPDEVLQAANERTKGVTDVAEKNKILADIGKEYALEMEIAAEITDAAKEDIAEFYRLTTLNPATKKGLKALHPQAEVYDAASGEWVPNFSSPDPEARKHAGILAMVRQVCEDFKTNGGAELKKGDKWFVTRAEWGAMTPEQRAGYWTFSDNDLVQRAQANVKPAVAARIKERREYLEARGYRRQPAAAPEAAKPPVTPAAGSPPAPRIQPPPSSSSPTATPSQLQARALAKNLESPAQD